VLRRTGQMSQSVSQELGLSRHDSQRPARVGERRPSQRVHEARCRMPAVAIFAARQQLHREAKLRSDGGGEVYAADRW